MKDIIYKMKATLLLLENYKRLLIATFGILLFVGLGITFFFSQETLGTAEATNELEQLTFNIRRYYQNRPDYWGLSTQTVLDKEIYPRKMLKNNQLIGFFGNSVAVGNGLNADVLMPGARNFDIIYRDLNKKQCIGLASFKFDQKFWLGVTGITIISGNKTHLFTWDNKTNRLPIQKDAAEDVCESNNTIIWHYE